MNKFRVEVGFDDEIERITVDRKLDYLDDIDPTGMYVRGYAINVKSDNTINTPAWENDMINGALDRFKGTNWSHVESIRY